MGDEVRIEEMISKLRKLFVITDFGRQTHFLGVKITFRTDRIFLSQLAYIQKVIQMANMADAKPTKYPLPMSHPLYRNIIDPSPEEGAKMKLLHFELSLVHYCIFRLELAPDIPTPVCTIAKFQSKPTNTN